MPEDTPPSATAPMFRSAFLQGAMWRNPFTWLFFIVAMNLTLPFVPVPARWMAFVGAIALTAFYVVCMVAFAASVARWQAAAPHWFGKTLTRPQVIAVALGILVGALAMWAFLQFTMMPQLGAQFMAMRRQNIMPSRAQFFQMQLLSTLGDVALIIAATMGGTLVARLIRSANILGPLCAMIALIDIWGVLFGGIVTQLLDKAPQASAAAITELPKMGQLAARTGVPNYPIPLPGIGAGDYLFLGLLFFALYNLHMNPRGAMRWTAALVTPVLLMVVFITDKMPGLLPIGLGIALPNLRFFRFTREEKFAMLYAGMLVIVLTAVLFFAVTSMLPASAPPTAPAPR